MQDVSGPPGATGRGRLEAPDNEIPGSVAIEAVLASTEDLVVFICGMNAYRSGIAFTVEVRVGPSRTLSDDLREGATNPFGAESSRILLGIEFADGRRCTSVPREHPPPGFEASADQPSLWARGGGGSIRSTSVSWFLSPLPPPGDLRIFFAWPAAGLPETTAALPADDILRAASRARELWPWKKPKPEVSEERSAPPVIPEGGWFAEHFPPDPGH
jgi:hypothetical protein